MHDYSHLATRIADTRYVQAAWFLEPCQNIVEVGGNKLREFLQDEHPRDRHPRHFWCIDPTASAAQWERHRVYAMPVTGFSFNEALQDKTGNGLCLLGMEMFDNEDAELTSAQHICENMNHFDIVVMEYVPSNPVARPQALTIYGAAQAVGLKLTVRLSTEWIRDAKYSEPNASFGKCREFWVMEKQ